MVSYPAFVVVNRTFGHHFIVSVVTNLFLITVLLIDLIYQDLFGRIKRCHVKSDISTLKGIVSLFISIFLWFFCEVILFKPAIFLYFFYPGKWWPGGCEC